MKRYVIGNWKSHKSSDDGRRWFDNFAAHYRPHPEVQVLLAPCLVSLESMALHLEGLGLENVSLVAQDISPFPKGSYTGAIAADLVKKMAGYVIVGHSERRRYFHETSQDILNKVTEAADSGLVPIVCVDSLEALSQLVGIGDIDCQKFLIAYTPVDALNFNIPESAPRVAETVARINEKYPTIPVVYGGALLPGNVDDYLHLPSLAGVFVGSASLQTESFVDICNKAAASSR